MYGVGACCVRRVVDVELGVPVSGMQVLLGLRLERESLSVECCIASTMVFVRSAVFEVDGRLKRFLTIWRMDGL